MIYDEGRPKADDGLGVDEEDGVDATVVLGVVGHLNNISPCRTFIFIYIYAGFRIRRIRMFLPCPDPDPHKFADPDPDPDPGKKVRK